MREVTPDFLGQDLMRQALQAQSLEPFDVPAAVLNSNANTLDKLNAYRAITFGLAGIAIRGWTNEIVQPNDFLAHSHRLHHPGNQWVFESVNLSDMEKGDILDPKRSLGVVTGSVALSHIENDMQETARHYMASYKGDRYVNGIDVYSVIARHHHHAVEAKNSGLMEKPVAYRRRSSFDRDFSPDYLLFKPAGNSLNPHYMNVETHGRAIAGTAGNIIRFSKDPIHKMMLRFAMPNTLSVIPEGITEEHIPLMIKNLLLDGIRASQRIDGVFTRSLEGGYEWIDIKTNKKYGAHLTWPAREVPPPRQLYSGDQAPTSGPNFQPVVYRQKCPVGYTAKAEEVMPGHRLVEGTMQYLHDNLLLHPYVYIQPPKKYGSVDEPFDQWLRRSASHSQK
ncbi:MAG TPA: hypothetical protein VF733_03450 [Candidatus Saccharimonadales bacterium]